MINKILDVSALLTIVVTAVVVIRLSVRKRRLEKIINANENTQS
jgi:hypothetical protein